MSKFLLTQETVEAATCPAGRKDLLLFDGELHGFGLRVTATGGKTFLAQYRAAAGVRRVPIGPFGKLTVKQARREALAILGDAAKGRDPFAERRAAVAAQVAAETAIKARAAAESYTFAKLVEQWAAARQGDRRASYLREAVACLRRNLPGWQDRPAASLTFHDAVMALDTIKATKGTVAANRTQAYGRAAFSWAVKRQLLAMNPLRGIERPGREVARERVLTADELGAIWRACDSLTPVRAAFIRTLMLTMQRREEVVSMRWAELDDPAAPAVWTLPGARAKNGRTHVVHLSDPASAILAALPRLAGNPCVFAGQSKAGPIGAFGTMKVTIDAAMAEAGRTIPEWRFHDFRRSGVTALAGLGFPPHVCDRLLNHVTGSIQGVAAVYQRHEFLLERKAALTAWAAHVLAAADGKSAPTNVVTLKRDAVA